MVDKGDADRLNRLFAQFLYKLIFDSGNKEPKVRIIEAEGVIKRLEALYAGVSLNANFHVSEGPKLYVSLSREATNGMAEKAEEELEKMKSNAQMRREHGYLCDRKVVYEPGELEVRYRIKKMPDSGEEENDLFKDLWGNCLRPLLKLKNST